MNSLRKNARLAGLLWLLAIIPIGFGLIYVRPKLIVFADAAVTANNIMANESLFRAAIASNIFGQILLLFWGLAIFRIFKTANKTWATIFLISVLVGTSV